MNPSIILAKKKKQTQEWLDKERTLWNIQCFLETSKHIYFNFLNINYIRDLTKF